MSVDSGENIHKGLGKHIFKAFIRDPMERNVKLEAESRIDSVVTGLPNDKAFIEMLKGLQSRWNRDSKVGVYNKGSFVVMDLAGLHGVNDTYGREAGGNDYLINVAETIKAVARGEDRFFRMGIKADEFVLYLPETVKRQDINRVMDRLDEQLKEKEKEAQIKYTGIRFKLSYAIAAFGEGYSPDLAYHEAANAMGEAKAAGKGLRVGDVGRLFVKTFDNV